MCTYESTVHIRNAEGCVGKINRSLSRTTNNIRTHTHTHTHTHIYIHTHMPKLASILIDKICTDLPLFAK